MRPVHGIDLILTITGGLAAALVLGYITHRLRLSPIVGYLLAGIAVGPHTPGFVANRVMAQQLAEIGVILLMFGVGLHFQLKELMAVRRVAIPGAIFQSLVATLLAAGVTRLFGWSWSSGIVFGLALAVASTVVLVRVLTDRRDLHTTTGHLAVGWLVVEDLFTVLVLVLLPAVFGDESIGPLGVGLSVGEALLKIGALVAFTLLAGARLVPWLLERVSATRSRELFTLTVLVLALGIAVGSAVLFGVSMALGAFLAGMVVGRSEFSLRAASEALPMRDAFAVLFFVSVGMLFDPRQLWESPGLVLATLGIVVVGKPLAALGLVLLMKYPLRVALLVAVALAQIGEFSFILAAFGQELGVLSAEATNVIVAAALVSITLNPLLYRAAGSLADRAARRRPAAEPGGPATGPSETPAHRAVIVGYGPVGRTVTRLLTENGVSPTVIELNLETVRRLRAEGVPAIYGDARHRETLESAGVGDAASLVLSSAGMAGSEEVARLARELNPALRILARSAYVHELSTLRRAGADAVFSGEGEIALALTEAILRDLGATPEQIDRERERVHADLLGDARPLAERRLGA